MCEENRRVDALKRRPGLAAIPDSTDLDVAGAETIRLGTRFSHDVIDTLAPDGNVPATRSTRALKSAA